LMSAEWTPEECRAFFAEVFAALDATPRTMKVKVFGEGLTIDLVNGNPVFKTSDGSAKADFRLRWLAEHPVPLTLGKMSVFTFAPTTGNRVKVRVK